MIINNIFQGHGELLHNFYFNNRGQESSDFPLSLTHLLLVFSLQKFTTQNQAQIFKRAQIF